VIFGTSATALTQSIEIANPATTTQVVGNLTPGSTYYFAARAVNSAGVESDNSNVGSKTIVGGTPPTASKTASVTVNKIPGAPSNVTVVETTVYDVRPNEQTFAFERGQRVGSVKLGAACDETRTTGSQFFALERPSRVVLTKTPRSTALVARCG
jgi:hypothetical protein